MSKKYSVDIIGIVGVPGRYGGFETMVDQLLPLEDVDVLVYCESAMEYSGERYKDARLRRVPLKANGVSSLFFDAFCLLSSVLRGSRVVLLLGVSGAWILPLVRLLRPSMRIVCNVDGVESRREKWGWLASRVLAFLELAAIRFSNEVIADNGHLVTLLSEKYQITPRLVAYGGDHVLMASNNPEPQTAGSVRQVGEEYALSICRIEPENNISMILDAFSRLQLKLIFVGNWKGSSYGRDLLRRYGHLDNIILHDPVYEGNYLHHLRSCCSYYVHGHSAGGTNPSLVEIMFYDCHLLCFDVNFNRVTVDGNASFFSSAGDLIDALGCAESEQKSQQRSDYAFEHYRWDTIREKYLRILFADSHVKNHSS